MQMKRFKHVRILDRVKNEHSGILIMVYTVDRVLIHHVRGVEMGGGGG